MGFSNKTISPNIHDLGFVGFPVATMAQLYCALSFPSYPTTYANDERPATDFRHNNLSFLRMALP
jgi:hypothetical protein